MVSTVTLNVTQACTTSPCPPNQAPYQFALTGDPESNVPVPPVVQPCGVLTLLGTNTDITFGTISSNLSVSAAGPIVIDSGYNTGNDPAIASGFFSSNTSVTATTNNTECPNTPAKDVMQVYDCNNTAANGGSANFQPCPTDSHNPVSQVSVSPSPVQTVAAPTDPLATWAAQNPVAAISSPTGSCTTSGTTITCNPGLYSSGLNITSSRTYKFNAGNYQFGSNAGCGASLCVNNSDIVNFGSGHYTYTDGLNVGGSGSALCGGGPVTSACPRPARGRRLLLRLRRVPPPSATSTTPTTSSSPPSLRRLTPTTASCCGRTAPTTIRCSLASAATSVNTYGGEIYVPNATISLYGFGNNITTGDVSPTASTLRCSRSASSSTSSDEASAVLVARGRARRRGHDRPEAGGAKSGRHTESVSLLAEHADSGDTLIEILIAIVVIALTVTALLSGLVTAITSSSTEQSISTEDSIVNGFAQAAQYEIQQANVFTNCTTTAYRLISAPFPSSGPVGSKVTVFVTGLAASYSPLKVALVSATNVPTSATVVSGGSTDAKGDASVTFTVPNVSGPQTVTVSDSGTTPVSSPTAFTAGGTARPLPPRGTPCSSTRFSSTTLRLSRRAGTHGWQPAARRAQTAAPS